MPSPYEDVRTLISVADTPPEEAVKNINNTKEADIPPDAHENLDDDFLKVDEPATTSRAVAKRIRNSNQEASAIRPDLKDYNFFERQWRFGSDAIEGNKISRRENDLNMKLAFGEDLSIDERVELDNLEFDKAELTTAKDFDYDRWDALAGNLAGITYGFGQTLWEGKGLTTTGAAIGGLIGGVGGFFVGGGLPGAVIGAKILGTAGATAFTTFGSIPRDTFRQSVGAIYKELGTTTINDGTEEGENRRRSIAKGGAFLSAMITVLPGIVAIKNVPFLRKAIGAKAIAKESAKIVNSKWGRVLLDIGQSGLAEAVEEGSQEAINIISEHLGKTWNEEEVSFEDALGNVVKDWNDKKGTTKERLGEAAFLGFFGGAAFTGSGKAISKAIDIGVDTTKKQIEKQPGDGVLKAPEEVVEGDFEPELPSDLVGDVKSLTPDGQGRRSLKLSDLFEQTNETIAETTVNKELPEVMTQMNQEMMDDNGVSSVYLDKNELNAWADNDEKAAAVENILTETNVEDSDLNAPVQISSGEFANLVAEFPQSISHLVKRDPEGPSAKAYADALNNGVKKTQQEDIFNGESYLEQKTFEKDEDNKELQDARKTIIENINEDVNQNTVVDLETQTRNIIAEEQRTAHIESDENISFVDDYLNNERVVGEKPKKGLAHSINPESLSRDLRNKYSDDVVLKKRKVFSKKGMNIDDVADYYGFETAEDLIDILASTPTREQFTKHQAKQERVVGVKKRKLLKAYRKLTKAHINEMVKIAKTFKDKVKGFEAPSIGALRNKAKNKIGKMKIKNLNTNQFKVGERVSQTKAQESLKTNDISETLKQKENAAFNSELSRGVHDLTGKINDAFAFIAKVNSPEVRQLLEEAGPTFINAVNSLMSFYKFSDTDVDLETRVKNYNKFVQKMKDEARGDFRILNENEDMIIEPKDNVMDMTVDEILFLNDKLKGIVKQASFNNEFIGGELGFENTTLEIMADEFRENAVNSPNFDPDKVETLENTTGLRSLGNKIAEAATAFNTMNWVLIEADNSIKNGFNSRFIYNPMMGTGRHKGKYGYSEIIRLQAHFKDTGKKAIAKYGEAKFRDFGITRVLVPEFKGNKSLNNGDLTKSELFMLLANMGNIENKQRIENFNVNPDVVMKVLKREFTVKEFDLVQELVWDTFEELKPMIADLQRVSGEPELDFVEAESFEAFGKTFSGGYMPIKYALDNKMIAQLTSEQEQFSKDPSQRGSMFRDNIYEGVVRSPHSKKRIGSNNRLSLELMSFNQGVEEFIHDLAMRVPTRNTMMMLSDPKVEESLKGLVGKYKYNLIVNTIAEQTKSVGARNQRLFTGIQGLAVDLLKSMEQGFTTAFIAFNPSSVVMSALAIPQIIKEMGPLTGGKYLTLATLELNPLTEMMGMNEDIYDLVRESDPTFNSYELGLDDYASGGIAPLLSKKRLFRGEEGTKTFKAVVKPYNYIKHMQERMNEIALGKLLGGIDARFKAIVTRAAYLQYAAGDAPGHPMSSLDGLTAEEIHQDAMGYAEQMSASTTMRANPLSKAPIQKIPGGRFVSKFWNESRGVLLSNIQQGRDIKRSAKAMVESANKGDAQGTARAMYGASATAGNMLIASMLAITINNTARGLNMFEDDESDEDLPFDEDLANAPKWIMNKVTTIEGAGDIAKNIFGSNMILVRDMIFSAESGRGVSFPLIRVLDDIKKVSADAIPYLIQAIADDLTLLEAVEGLKENEVRSMLNLISYLSGGIPVSGPIKIKRWFEDQEFDTQLPSISDGLDIINNFIEKNDKNVDESSLTFEQRFALAQREEGEDNTVTQDIVDQVKELRDVIQPPNKGEPLPRESYEVIKHAESSNNWRHNPDTSSTFGIYQFSKDKWNAIVNSPEGKRDGITTRGRVLRDSAQQEKAMRILTKWNQRDLIKNDVPVNIETLYYSHHFGVEGAAKVYKSSDNKSISKILNRDVLEANPQLVKDKVKTAGDMKKYIKKELKRGRESYEADL